MKAIEILQWIFKESVNGEFLNIIEVPEEGDEPWEQNEQWWTEAMGNCPPRPIEEGKYLYFYESQVDNNLGTADAQIEIPEEHGFDYINLFKIEDDKEKDDSAEIKKKIMDGASLGLSYVVKNGAVALEVSVAYRNNQDKPENFTYNVSFHTAGRVVWCENGIYLDQAVEHVKQFKRNK